MDELPGAVNRERKQSSGDLHSRLKTRKLLGVGETDDGDVHRSKLSQILGHSDQLYARLPRGAKEWQLLMAAAYSCVGIATFVQPNLMYQCPNQQVFLRLYAGCLISISVGYWMAWRSQDREVAQFSMLCAMAHSFLQLIAAAATVLSNEPPKSGEAPSRAACLRWPLLAWLSLQPICLISGACLLRATLRSHRRSSKLQSGSPAHLCSPAGVNNEPSAIPEHHLKEN